MNRILMILMLFMVIQCVGAVKFSETVTLPNGGTLTATTSGGGMSDSLNSRGEQSYTRSLTLEEENKQLVSKYQSKELQKKILKSSFYIILDNGTRIRQFYENSPNSYTIALANKNYLSHSLAISNSEGLESDSGITFSGGMVKTNFKVSGSGDARERLAGLEVGGGRPQIFASLSLSSNNFSIVSGAESESYLNWDVNQSSKVDNTITGSQNTSLINWEGSTTELLLGSTKSGSEGTEGNGKTGSDDKLGFGSLKRDLSAESSEDSADINEASGTRALKGSSAAVGCDSQSNTCDTHLGDGSDDEAAPSEDQQSPNSDASDENADENDPNGQDLGFGSTVPPNGQSSNPSKENVTYDGVVFSYDPRSEYYINESIVKPGVRQSTYTGRAVLSPVCNDSEVCKWVIHISYRQPMPNPAAIVDLDKEYYVAPTY
jgi:hypothetical protein